MIQTRSLFAILLTVIFCSAAMGQSSNSYRYQRPITGITETWHKITLPCELVGKLSPSLSDLRILGVTSKHDTVEAPYIIRIGTESVSQEKVNFRIINQSHSTAGYFFTFEVPRAESLNAIKLEFAEQNFDWRLNLQGSHDNSTWFTLTENYRILSLNNSHTQYKFTEVVFPDAKFSYLRVQLMATKRPTLVSANLLLTKTISGNYRSYGVTKPRVTNSRKEKQTIVAVNLPNMVPVSYVKLWIHEKFDYYRPITIAYISDSVTAQKGKIYSYETLYSGTLTSLDNRIFKFDNRVAKRLRITIDNNDNQPLTIDSIEVRGNIYELIARFTRQGSYFLAYGNNNYNAPNYDIGQFTDKIPDKLKEVTLGAEEQKGEQKNDILPLFQNKLWLWLVIGAIGAILGWFTLKMMRQQQA